MKRSLIASVLVFVASALVGTALNARAEAKGTDAKAQDVTSIYWAH